jgi:uncharacterized protein (UPF0332 family)
MQGSDFLSVAIRLSGAATEADWRSSVSRAYYGAFHEAHALVKDCGVILPKTAEAHDKLQWCLQHAADDALTRAAEKLNSLRAERNAADYDLDSPRFGHRLAALLQLKIAREIVDALSACRADRRYSELRSSTADSHADRQSVNKMSVVPRRASKQCHARRATPVVCRGVEPRAGGGRTEGRSRDPRASVKLP